MELRTGSQDKCDRMMMGTVLQYSRILIVSPQNGAICHRITCQRVSFSLYKKTLCPEARFINCLYPQNREALWHTECMISWSHTSNAFDVDLPLVRQTNAHTDRFVDKFFGVANKKCMITTMCCWKTTFSEKNSKNIKYGCQFLDWNITADDLVTCEWLVLVGEW